jgi:hypothetical protein
MRWAPLVALLGAGFSSVAEAGVVALDFGSELNPWTKEVATPALGMRYGHEIDLLLARLTPEVGLEAVPEFEFLGGIAGARISFLRILEPGAYAHVGYGGVFGEPSWFTTDGGLFLDLAISKLRIGVHGGVEGRPYDGERSQPVLTAGLHTALKL